MSAFHLKDPKGRPSSVPHHSPYGAYRHEASVMVSEAAIARIRTAHEGIRSIITILQNREVDMECDGDVMALSSTTVIGLINALACCADFAELHATGDSPGYYTQRFECNTTTNCHE